MHKKLASDLISLAHSILQMKAKDDVFALKEKAHQVYEKLSLLAYVEEYINTTPNAIVTKEELLLKIEEIEEKSQVFIEKEENTEEEIAENIIEVVEDKNEEAIIEQPFDELENLFNSNEKDDIRDVGETKSLTLEEELKDTVSVDTVVELFEKAEDKNQEQALQELIQIELSDRIDFVKHLFDDNQGEFNRVISQLNTFSTVKEAKKFLKKTVKPDYNWAEKTVYETRLLEIIESRFS